MWEASQKCNITYVKLEYKGEERENKAKEISEVVMKKNFLKLMTDNK